MIEVTWLLFVVASVALIVTPGQDLINVLAWLYRTSGAVLVGLGLKLAFERRT